MILPVTGQPVWLKAQLDALACQTYDAAWELVVADNGCAVPVGDVLERWRADVPVRIVAARGGRGVSFARNRGIAAAKGELLVFCDADDVVGDAWLEGLTAAARSADLVGGRLEEEVLNGGPGQLRPRMPVGGLPVALGFLPFAVGANFAVWADVVADIGGFDERFIGGNDDVEFSFRAQLAGRRLAYAGDAVVAYRHRERGRDLFRQFCSYGLTEPLLYRYFHNCGMSRPPVYQVAKRWLRVIFEAPLALTPTRRGAWLVRAAFSLGRLRGAVRYRAPYL